MTPSRKGLYAECVGCRFLLKDGSKYPCSKSHKEVRGKVRYERDFTKCLVREDSIKKETE